MTFGLSANTPQPPSGGGDWRDRAACAGMDLALWFPNETGNSNAAFEARKICRACDVQTECLQYAMDTRQAHGIWGGLSERQRRDLRRSHTITVRDHGTHHGYNAHIRKREPACEACKTAHARYTAEVRARRRSQ